MQKGVVRQERKSTENSAMLYDFFINEEFWQIGSNITNLLRLT